MASDSEEENASKKKKKHKEQKEHKKKEKKKDKHKKKSKKSAHEGESTRPSDVPEISDKDYFDKNAEFRIWLLESNGAYFDELTSEQTRFLFKKFAKKWNAGKVAAKLYKGITVQDIDGQARTRHKWSFVKQLDAHEEATLRDTVGSLSSRSWAEMSGKPQPPKIAQARDPVDPPARAKRDLFDVEEEREQLAKKAKLERQAWQQRQKLSEDELCPKPDAGSFEARLAKRKEKGAYAHRERADDFDVPESTLMGGSSDDYKAKLDHFKARQHQRLDSKAEVNREKLERFAQAEQAKMAQLAALAERFKAGGGIAPRSAMP